MPDQFKLLLQATLDDDQAGVKELLEHDPALAGETAKKASLEAKIAHWVYARDTALHVASAGYRVEIAKLLLDAGADPCAAANHRRSQPLHYASDGYLANPDWNAERQVRMIELLLEAGADLHAQDKNGATPLHRAVRTRCAAAVKCLLEAGADAALRNKPGSTPFHLAVQNTGRGGSGSEKAKAAQREIIETFLEHGISPTLKDQNGKTVFEWARNVELRQSLSRDAKNNSTKPATINHNRRNQ